MRRTDIGRDVGSGGMTYHSKSLYMMVKKTWRNRLTALINTAKRYNQASPDILTVCYALDKCVCAWVNGERRGEKERDMGVLELGDMVCTGEVVTREEQASKYRAGRLWVWWEAAGTCRSRAAVLCCAVLEPFESGVGLV